MKLSNLLITSLIASSITSNCFAQQEKNKTPQKPVSKVQKDTVDIIYPPNEEEVKTLENSKGTMSPPKRKTYVIPKKAIKPTKRRPMNYCPGCGLG